MNKDTKFAIHAGMGPSMSIFSNADMRKGTIEPTQTLFIAIREDTDDKDKFDIYFSLYSIFFSWPKKKKIKWCESFF